jgi:hypothetical protein
MYYIPIFGVFPFCSDCLVTRDPFMDMVKKIHQRILGGLETLRKHTTFHKSCFLNGRY